MNTKVVLALADEQLVAGVVAGQLELALLNLVRNAADASPPSGIITISTRLHPPTRR